MKQARLITVAVVSLGLFALTSDGIAAGTTKTTATSKVHEAGAKSNSSNPRSKAVATVKAPIDPDGARVLDPVKNKFAGRVATGYKLARKNPGLTKTLFCYCGCDLTELHKSLLDCYTDKNRHAADCVECIDELITASAMLQNGRTLPEIQKALHVRWASHYPFTDPTPAYQAYLQKTKLKFSASKDAEPLPVAPVSGTDVSPPTAEQTSTEATPEATPAKRECCPKHNAAIDRTSSNPSGTPVIPVKPSSKPKQKFDFPPDGPKALAEDAVKKYPDLIAKLPCACGCPKKEEHASLLDCFASNEAAECSVCLEEAAIAGRMHADGATDDAIKKLLNELYPAKTPD